MEEILIIVVQFLVEFLFSAVASIPFDGPSFTRKTPESENRLIVNFSWLILGCIVAGISLLFFQQTLISVSIIRLINIILAPIAAAYLSEAIAEKCVKVNSYLKPRNHFWQAFWFTLGLTLTRFAFAARS